MINIVNSHNEWDQLEEVIVGSVIGAASLAYEPAINAYRTAKSLVGQPYSEKEIELAETQLNNLVTILQQQGITVKRPDKANHFKPFVTPEFERVCANSTACPRDVLLIIGNEIIEATMGFRARFFEYLSYRTLIKNYFYQGARWSAAPKPSMSDQLYVKDFSVEHKSFHADTHPALTNFEPCFDAASFTRMGKDIFYHPDIVTNDFGAKWLERHLGNEYRLHRVLFKYEENYPPEHIDTTFVPLREGLLLVNPERYCIDNTLDLFKQNGWEIVEGVPSVLGYDFLGPFMSKWVSMNMLSINEDTVIVEEKETPMIKLLESLGFKVITCPFEHVYQFGGSFHCCVLDIRRKSMLKSYFPTLD